MKIFIIGSYFEKSPELIKKNIEKANKTGIKILKKGHLPFVPQSMFAFWENKVNKKLIMKSCFDWIKNCDAVFLSKKPRKGSGPWKALSIAKKYNKIIYKSLREIPGKGSASC